MRTITKIDYNGLTLSDGTRILHEHEQDCCENVYADWKAGFEDVDLSTFDVSEIDIENVENSGFRLNGQFVPCYDEQNGYYSSDLRIEVVSQVGNILRSVNVDSEARD